MSSLAMFCQALRAGDDYTWAWENYKPTIIQLIQDFGLKSVMEIGAGRHPLFTPEEAATHEFTYYINDVSVEELEKAGADYPNKIQTDIAVEVPNVRADLIISRMVYEHIHNNKKSLQHQYEILNPGGFILHFHPVLYSIPFIANRILDPKWSEWLLRQMGNRSVDDHPKFPAYYDWCRATRAQRKRVQSIGFTEAELIPFYGHGYYRRLPVVREIHRYFTRLIVQLRWRYFATYCYTMARK